MPESRILWLRINTQSRETIPFKVSNTQLYLQDEYINLDDITELEDASIFKVHKLQTQPFEWNDYTQMDITFEMDLN